MALLHFYVWLPVAVGENGNVPKLWLGELAFLVEGSAVLESRGLVAYNGFGLSGWAGLRSTELSTCYKLIKEN